MPESLAEHVGAQCSATTVRWALRTSIGIALAKQLGDIRWFKEGYISEILASLNTWTPLTDRMKADIISIIEDPACKKHMQDRYRPRKDNIPSKVVVNGKEVDQVLHEDGNYVWLKKFQEYVQSLSLADTSSFVADVENWIPYNDMSKTIMSNDNMNE